MRNTREHAVAQNLKLAQGICSTLIKEGLRDFCLCPGARNAPLIELLLAWREAGFALNINFFYDERSAAFFALGRAQAQARAVAVVTTSGTAVGELLPAVMEAYYSATALVLLSADRPSSYRGTGAPQTAEQPGIFGYFVERSLDFDTTSPQAGALGQELGQISQLLRGLKKPLHLNLCFDEPLSFIREGVDLLPPAELVQLMSASGPLPVSFVLDSDSLSFSLFKEIRDNFLAANTLVIVGRLPAHSRQKVLALLLRWQCPVYLESLSGLQGEFGLAPQRVHLLDSFFEEAQVDRLIRIGGIPTHRLWRDLEGKYLKIPVLSLSDLPFSGLSRDSQFLSLEAWLTCEIELDGTPPAPDFIMHGSLRKDQDRRDHLTELLEKEPRSEAGMIYALSLQLGPGSRVYLGNSLPIREWDLVASGGGLYSEIWAARGLNGIDGQLSHFFGFAKPSQDNWAILGDLTTLYDLSAPWVLPQLMPEIKTQLVVINNGGGKIFETLFPRPEFQNSHQVSFEYWAKLWDLNYAIWQEVPMGLENSQEEKNSARSRVIELRPDPAASKRFWTAFSSLLDRR